MKKIIVLFFLCSALNFLSQENIVELKVGDQAPSFILTLQQNMIESFTIPYLNRIVLLHFWSGTVSQSRAYNKHLNRFTGRYKNAMYRSADGFDVFAIAVQSDKNLWKKMIGEDSLNNFIHGIANKGYNEAICKKYNISTVPTDILIDERGKIIAMNPHINELENILDDRKNFRPIKNDITGTIALSSDPAELLKFGKLFLFDGYGDSIQKTTTTANGSFFFSEVKLSQDFILKIDNKSNIVTSDPLALYSYKGEKILDGTTSEKGFVFYIPAKISHMLTESEKVAEGEGVTNVDVVRNLIFKNNGTELTSKDEHELNSIYQILQKNMSLSVDVVAHTDSKLDEAAAMDLTTKQSNTVKNYFVNKGISPARIKMVPKGKTDPRNKCLNGCNDEDHKQNRRVEFVVYKS